MSQAGMTYLGDLESVLILENNRLSLKFVVTRKKPKN